jgi:hypothetical protein
MREFKTYLAYWNKSAFGIAAAAPTAASDKLSAAVWAIAHFHLRS